MRADAVALLDHLKIARARMIGYSMGGRITLEVLMRDPERLSAIVLGGYGEGGQIATPGQRHRIAAALLAENPAVIEDVLARRFRRGAERNGKDLRALAACIGAEETTDAESALDYDSAAPCRIAGADRDRRPGYDRGRSAAAPGMVPRCARRAAGGRGSRVAPGGSRDSIRQSKIFWRRLLKNDFLPQQAETTSGAHCSADRRSQERAAQQVGRASGGWGSSPNSTPRRVRPSAEGSMVSANSIRLCAASEPKRIVP